MYRDMTTEEWCATLHHYETSSITVLQLRPDGRHETVVIHQTLPMCARCGAPKNQGGRCPGRKS